MAVINHSGVRAEIPFAIDDPERIPKQRYYDEAFFALERERLWPHIWQFACRLEEIDAVGDWMEYRNLDQSILVVRTSPDTVRAFDNSCRHRGVRLGVGRGNCAQSGFICPFHGWCYDMNGANTYIYRDNLFSEAALERGEINLQECQVDVWGGSVFVNQDPDAPPLRDHLGILPELLDARNIDGMKTVSWRATEIPCNWKFTIEAFYETYHVKQTHPQVMSGRVDDYGTRVHGQGVGSLQKRAAERDQWFENQINQMRLIAKGGSGVIQPKDIDVARGLRDLSLPDDPTERATAWDRELNDAISRWGHSVGISSLPDLNSLPPLPHIIFTTFPNYHLTVGYGNAALYRVRPLTAETCVFENWQLTHVPESGHEAVKEATWLPTNDSGWGEFTGRTSPTCPCSKTVFIPPDSNTCGSLVTWKARSAVCTGSSTPTWQERPTTSWPELPPTTPAQSIRRS